MRKRKIPFLKCCEWLYLGAMAVGILYMVQGFRQEELARVIGFPEAEGLLRLITAGTFAAQFLIMWSDEADYRVQMWLGIFALNAVAGFFLMRNLEQPVIFWSYVGLEAACIVAAAVVYAIRYFKVLKGILVLAQAVALTVLAIQELSLPGWCVCIMMVGFLIFLVELASGERKEVLGLLPLFAAVMLLLGVLPRSAEPLDWSGVQQAWTNLKEKAQMLVLDIQYLFQGEKEFSFSFAGYGEEGGLGGSVSDSGQEQLHITGAATKNPLYLTGSVYEVYTGEGWESAKETTEVGPQTEKVGIQKALDQSIHAQRGDLVSSVQIAVEYRFIKTEDFFHELNTTNLYFPKDKAKFENGSPWTLRSAEGKDFNYWLNYVEFNEKSEEIQAIRASRHGGKMQCGMRRL